MKLKTFLYSLLLSTAIGTAAYAAPETPGPSLGRWDEPYYKPAMTTANELYVSTTGNDSTANGSESAPFATLQGVNDFLAKGGPTAGAGKVVIVEPGTYNSGVLISVGGNAATSTGYLAYRCAVMDKCIITGSSANGGGSFAWQKANGPGSYVIIDGFVLQAGDAASTGLFGIGVQVWDDEPGAEKDFAVHHIVVENSIVSGYGQAGINMNDGEYFYVLHNTVYNNANAGCSAQGSGIAYVVLKPAPNYTPTHDDSDSPLVGNIGNFHNVIAWNVVYNNATTKCGTASNPYDTDGNGIIFDTLNNNGLASPYVNQTLAAFNVAYNNGGVGIHVFNSEYVTVANNSVYNNDLDPYDQGADKAGIDTNGSYANTIFNNLVVAIPSPNNGMQNGGTGNSCAFSKPPYQKFASAMLAGGVSGKTPDVFTNNITQLRGGYKSCWAAWGNDAEDPAFSPDTYSATANHKNTNPGWVSVGTIGAGSETVPPNPVNFALTPGSASVGTGLKATYLSTQSVDMGACSSQLTQCP